MNMDALSAPGTLSVLNAQLGDLKISFDHDEEEEVKKACKMVEDLLQAGYTLLVDTGDGSMQRAESFDSEAVAYVVQDMDFRTARGAARRRRRKTKKLPAKKTRGVAVGRSAGG